MRRTKVVVLLTAPEQTKESVRRYVIYCVALCGCGPYVSIVWGSAICFYCVAIGHMFLLCGARPYVSIMWRSAICFYYVALGHMFLLCGARPYVSIVCVDHMFS